MVYQAESGSYHLRDKACGGEPIIKIQELEGRKEVLVGRLKGEIEIYGLMDGNLNKKYSFNGGEGVLTLDATGNGEYLAVSGNQIPVSVYRLL